MSNNLFSENSSLQAFNGSSNALRSFDQFFAPIPILGQIFGSTGREAERRAYEREDTAVQRKMADLKAAGLNPILAAGGQPASSSSSSASVSSNNKTDLVSTAMKLISILGMKN